MLLAIDPGACSGWAFFLGNGLIDCGIGDPPPPGSLLQRIVIEHPVIYPGGRTANPNSIVKLAINAGEWGGRYRHLGCAVDYVLPATWKGRVKAEVCIERTRAALKPTEKLLVEIRESNIAKSKRHNMLDAIGLGLFACGRGKP